MGGIRLQKRTNSFALGVVLFLIGAVVFGWLGYYMLSGNLEMIKNGERTKATVVQMTKHTAKKSVTYRPVFQYLIHTGETLTTEYSSGSSNSKAFKVGQEVTIYYSKADPRNILIDRFFDKYGFPVIFLFAGVVSFFIVIVMTVRKIKYGVA